VPIAITGAVIPGMVRRGDCGRKGPKWRLVCIDKNGRRRLSHKKVDAAMPFDLVSP